MAFKAHSSGVFNTGSGGFAKPPGDWSNSGVTWSGGIGKTAARPPQQQVQQQTKPSNPPPPPEPTIIESPAVPAPSPIGGVIIFPNLYFGK
jgi:hypothetical protein